MSSSLFCSYMISKPKTRVVLFAKENNIAQQHLRETKSVLNPLKSNHFAATPGTTRLFKKTPTYPVNKPHYLFIIKGILSCLYFGVQYLRYVPGACWTFLRFVSVSRKPPLFIWKDAWGKILRRFFHAFFGRRVKAEGGWFGLNVEKFQCLEVPDRKLGSVGYNPDISHL